MTNYRYVIPLQFLASQKGARMQSLLTVMSTETKYTNLVLTIGVATEESLEFDRKIIFVYFSIKINNLSLAFINPSVL